MWSSIIRRASRRDIYRYWDGSRWRARDPLVAWRAIWEDPDVDPKIDFELATGLNSRGENVEYNPESQDKVLAMIRRIFDVEQFSESHPRGLTINETFALLWDFLRYANSLKKKPSPTPTPSPPTGSESSDGSSTTRPASDSSSTRSEPTSAEPPKPLKRSVAL